VYHSSTSPQRADERSDWPRPDWPRPGLINVRKSHLPRFIHIKQIIVESLRRIADISLKNLGAVDLPEFEEFVEAGIPFQLF
jgi:hypothetical protein